MCAAWGLSPLCVCGALYICDKKVIVIVRIKTTLLLVARDIFMIPQKKLDRIIAHIVDVIAESSPLGISLWQDFLQSHPADIAQFLGHCDRNIIKKLFLKLPEQHKLDVFEELSDALKVFCLSLVSDQDRSYLLGNLPIDELTDFLDELSDDELKKYLRLLHKKDREQVLSLLKFDSESAGGIMDSNVLSLMQDFTVERAVQIVQRLQPDRDLYQNIFVTNKYNELVGYIKLEDLVLKHPKTRLSSILYTNELVVIASEDREAIAQKMMHYHVMIVPVTSQKNIFLGVITSDTLVEIVEQEASEDLYRMAAMTPIKNTYFETPFFNLLYQRSIILVGLLFVQSLSTSIIHHYQTTLEGFLLFFITMLTSTGGNASNQTSALAIQGIATGEIDSSKGMRFIRREFQMAIIMSLLLGVFAFIRTYLTYGNWWGCFTVSVSLSLIVLFSVMLGSCLPLILKRFNIDPAHSAGPILATLIDVFGLLIYCSISQLMFK
jgi:Mg2+ transporter (mgtE)